VVAVVIKIIILSIEINNNSKYINFMCEKPDKVVTIVNKI
jgi:hypothetical protein